MSRRNGKPEELGPATTPAGEADRTPHLVLLAGALYVAAIFGRDWVLRAFGIPSEVSSDYLWHSGTLHVVANFALRAPALLVIGIIWFRRPSSRLRASLSIESAQTMAWTVAVTVAVTFLLNLFGFWPFTWRWASDQTRLYLGALVASAQWFALLVWVLTAVIVGPLIEELVFRFGVLQAVRDWTGSSAKAVIVSSAVFALGHLGYLPPDFAHLVNAAWLFAASLVLGSITLRLRGWLGVSLAAHAARNSLEVSLLFLLGNPGVG